jgi:hypothetical protein
VQVVKYFWTSPNLYDIVVIEPYGGAINAVPVRDSAFIHRNVYMDFFVDSFFFESGEPTSRGEAEAWLKGFMNLMQPYFNGHMYQNYPIRNFPGFGTAYWDAPTFLQLQKVKTEYDAGNFFRFEQSIPPAADAAKIRGISAPSFLKRLQRKAKSSTSAKRKKVVTVKAQRSTASTKQRKVTKLRKTQQRSGTTKRAVKGRTTKTK